MIIENKKCRREKRKNRLNKIKKIGFTYLNTALLAAGVLSSAYALKDVTKSKNYLTTTTTYDTSTEEETKNVSYEERREDEVTLVEYSPWEAPGYFRDEYARNVYTYDLSDLEVILPNVQSYLDSKLKDDISFSKKEETALEKPKDFDYQENKYVITSIKQNTDKFKYDKERSKMYLEFATLLAALGIITIDYIFVTKVLRINKYGSYNINYKHAKKDLKKNNVELLESKNQLDELEVQLDELHRRVLAKYEALPVTIKDSPKVKEKIRLLNGNNDN